MKKRRVIHLALSILLTFGLVFPTGMPTYAGTNAYIFDISQGDITITEGTPTTSDSTLKITYGQGEEIDQIASSQEITIIKTPTLTEIETSTETPTENCVIVDGVTANITIKDLNIDGSAKKASAFGLVNQAKVTLTLVGKNSLKGGELHAGLEVQDGETITIQGEGSVNATGGPSGAGIGGGRQGDGGAITISGGEVTATGGSSSSGIGGGFVGAGGAIAISGGEVTATGADYAAGIGGGVFGAGGIITISGGEVSATGGSSSAGIGSGYNGAGGTVTISGGEVTARGGSYGVGIGGGENGAGGTVTISGGKVTAIGGSSGAGIGAYTGSEIGSTLKIDPAASVMAISSGSKALNVETDESSAILMSANFWGSKSVGTLLEVYNIATGSKEISYKAEDQYGTIAFTVQSEGPYHLICNNTYQQYKAEEIAYTEFNVASSGITYFTNIMDIENRDQEAPTGLVGVAPTTIDNNDGKITGTTTEMEYRVSGESAWIAVTGREITGLSSGSYDVRYEVKIGFHASPSVEVKVADYLVPNEGQGAPTGLVGIAPTAADNKDGKISGTTTEMEYKESTEATWTTATLAEITGLSSGTYQVRYAAKIGFNASSTVAVTVADYVAPNEDQLAPAGLQGIAPTIADNNDGKISGTTSEMEYQASGASTWMAVTGAEITGLSSGSYDVRFAGKTGFNASASVEVIVGEFEEVGHRPKALIGERTFAGQTLAVYRNDGFGLVKVIDPETGDIDFRAPLRSEEKDVRLRIPYEAIQTKVAVGAKNLLIEYRDQRIEIPMRTFECDEVLCGMPSQDQAAIEIHLTEKADGTIEKTIQLLVIEQIDEITKLVHRKTL